MEKINSYKYKEMRKMRIGELGELIKIFLQKLKTDVILGK